MEHIKSFGIKTLTPLVRSSTRHIKQRIDRNDTVSFDVFGTLIKRDVRNPEDVFDIVGRAAEVEGFRELRISAERKARKLSTAEDVTLDEIYEEITIPTHRVEGVEKVESGAEFKRRLMDAELEAEYEQCGENPKGRELFNYCKENHKRMLLISNMYLPEEFIGRLLGKCGYEGYGKFYVSCEHGLRKGTGNLFKAVREETGMKTWLHIGDNIAADGYGALKGRVRFAIL